MSWQRSLAAGSKSPKTIRTYTEALGLLHDFLVAQGMPTGLSGIHREHIEAWLVDILARQRPATASNRYRAAKVFFAWVWGPKMGSGQAASLS